MVKTLAAAGVLALAGSALAAPFQVSGGQIGATGAFNDPQLFGAPGTEASTFNAGGGGTFAGATTNFSSPLAQDGNYLGANPGGAPAAIAASASAGALVAAVDAFTGVSDGAYNVGFTIPDAANWINSAEGAFGNDVWLGRVSGANLDVFTIEVAVNGTVAGVLVLDGDGAEIGGQVVFAKSSPVGSARGGSSTFDVIITDAPAPGAAALLGLAGIAGLRRRRA